MRWLTFLNKFLFNETFFFVWFLPSGVATADFPPPAVSIFCILLRHFNHCLVLSHRIHKPPFIPSPFPLSWQLHPQHPSPNIPIIFPINLFPLIPACTARPGLPLSPPEIAFLESPYYRPQTASTSIADRHHPKTFIQSPTHKTMTLQAGYDNDHK